MKKNTSATSSEGYRITVPQQYEDDSYPNITDTIIINQRRNTSGVGKVKGYTLHTLPAGSTSTKNNTSMFGNLQKTTPSVSPSNVTPEMPDFNTDFNLDNEYKKIKELTKLMRKATQNLEFEQAMVYRDQLREPQTLALKNT